MRDYNNVDLKGRLHSYQLTELNTEKGTAISGSITIEVDENGTLVEAKVFAYPTYNNKKPNKNYNILNDIMIGNTATVADNGDEAEWLSVSGQIDVNYFVPRDGAKSIDELARAQKIRASFINPNAQHKYANKWKVDMLITEVTENEEDTEKNIPRYARVNGFIIDSYNERVNEVSFQARKEEAINYVTCLPASKDEPYYVSVWGEMQTVSRSIVRKNAFGEDEVDSYDSIYWVLTGMSPDAYDFAENIEDYKAYKAELNELKEERLRAATETAAAQKLSF